MAGKMLYVLAGYDQATQGRLAGMQDKLYAKGFCGEHTRGIPMHVTLGSFPVEGEDALIARLKETASICSAFDVTFHHIGIFSGSKVLFVAPDCNPELLALKERFGGGSGWTPHTTMLIDAPEAILRAVPIMLEEFSAFSGQVTTLHLYEFWPTRHILSAPLG